VNSKEKMSESTTQNIPNLLAIYQQFQRDFGKIYIKYSLPKSRAYLRQERGHHIIEISGQDDFQEQVKSFIHELLHLAPQHRWYLDGNYFLQTIKNEHISQKHVQLEAAIDAQTQQIYQTDMNTRKALEIILLQNAITKG